MTTWLQIATLDAPAGGVFDFPSLSLGAYSLIQVIGAGITVSTDDSELWITLYQSGVEVASGTNYRWGLHQDTSSSGGNTDNSSGASKMNIHSNDTAWKIGNAAGEGIGFSVTFDAPGSTSLAKKGLSEAVLTLPSGNVAGAEGMVMLNATPAIDGIKISVSAGTLLAGKIRILGLV